MHSTQKITDNIWWVGGNDRRLERFENIFPLPQGVSYNSYLIRDEKNTLMDTVDGAFIGALLDNVNHRLEGEKLDYLVITHMEPDHSASMVEICRRYPNMKIVASAKALQMIGQFFYVDLADRYIEVKEGDTLSLGKHTLQFVAAPMVHWPEVLMAYETSEKLFFSADAFGTFGALNGPLFADETNFEAEFLDEARRYYSNIVGKYGPQVQAVLKKAAALDINMILPLHGPVWRENIGYFLEKYDLWSRYEPEQAGVVIAYGSMYGNTEAAANILAGLLAERGVNNISVFDISKTHASYIVGETFKYSHLVVAAPTYNMGVYLPMASLLHDLAALNVQNRKVSIVGNGSWAPAGLGIMQKSIEAMKNMELVGEPVKIISALKQDQMPEMEALADAIATSVKQQAQ